MRFWGRATQNVLLLTSGGKPTYMRDLLDVIALPPGAQAHFTYKRRRFDDDAYAAFRQTQVARGVLGYLLLSASGRRVLPLRYVSEVRLAEEPSTDDSEVALRVQFRVGGFASAVDAARLATIAASGVSEPNVDLPQYVRIVPQELLREAKDQKFTPVTEWLSFLNSLRGTPLGAHILFHVAGTYHLGSRFWQRRSPIRACSRAGWLPRREIGYSRYAFQSARLYSVEVYSSLPDTVDGGARLRVTSDTSVLSVAYPQLHTVAGIRPNQVVLLQVQRLQDTLDTAVSIEMEFAKPATSTPEPSWKLEPVKEAQGQAWRASPEPNTEAGTENPASALLSPRVTFGVRCHVSLRTIGAAAVFIIVGLLLARVNAEAIVFAANRLPDEYRPPAATQPTTVAPAVPVFQAVGFGMVALAAYVGFRKIPG